MRVEVTVKHSDLSYTRYEYWLKGVTLYLDKVFVLDRPTKRHKLQINRQESYSRVDQREYGIKKSLMSILKSNKRLFA